MCSLSDNVYDYPFVSQGKVTVPSIDDSEEMQMADVRSLTNQNEKKVILIQSLDVQFSIQIAFLKYRKRGLHQIQSHF